MTRERVIEWAKQSGANVKNPTIPLMKLIELAREDMREQAAKVSDERMGLHNSVSEAIRNLEV